MTITDPIRRRVAVVPQPAVPAPLDVASWRDALVELLVLAEHGDLAAETSLRGWLSVDPSAAAASAAIRCAVDAVRSA